MSGCMILREGSLMHNLVKKGHWYVNKKLANWITVEQLASV